MGEREKQRAKAGLSAEAINLHVEEFLAKGGSIKIIENTCRGVNPNKAYKPVRLSDW